MTPVGRYARRALAVKTNNSSRAILGEAMKDVRILRWPLRGVTLGEYPGTR